MTTEGTQQSAADLIPEGFVIEGRYVVERVLGAGRMGIVYLVRDTLLFDNRVAMKIFRASLSQHDVLVQRFFREAKLMSEIGHENVVRLYETGEIRGRHYFTMEHVEGETLSSLVAASGALAEPDVPVFALSLFEGLDAIHSAGIVHRDIKPGNIFFSQDGLLKIGDFGYARAGASDLTHHSKLVYDLTYSAPEVLLEREATVLSDLYSAGVVLFEAATGVSPFKGVPPAQTLKMRITQPPPSVQELWPEAPQWLDALVSHLLASKPKQRPDSAAQVVEWIRQALRPEL